MAPPVKKKKATATAAPKPTARANFTVKNDLTGKPLANATVEIGTVDRGVTDAKGKWRSGVFPTGAYDVTVTLPGFGPVPPPGTPRQDTPWKKSITFKKVTNGTNVAVQLVPAKARIVLQVVDVGDSNFPVKGGNVTITTDPPPALPAVPTFMQSAFTDGTGALTSEPFAPGKMQVSV